MRPRLLRCWRFANANADPAASMRPSCLRVTWSRSAGWCKWSTAWQNDREDQMKAALAVIVIIIVIVIGFFGYAMSAKNQIVTEQQAIRQQWANVDVVLQRRADLIPNLVETVKGYAKQEQTVIKS